MYIKRSSKGFEELHNSTFLDKNMEHSRLVSQSFVVNPQHINGFEKLGSLYLWVGDYHHLDREEVQQLIYHLQSWVDNGTFELVCGSCNKKVITTLNGQHFCKIHLKQHKETKEVFEE